jgi:hypothetical protein
VLTPIAEPAVPALHDVLGGQSARAASAVWVLGEWGRSSPGLYGFASPVDGASVANTLSDPTAAHSATGAGITQVTSVARGNGRARAAQTIDLLIGCRRDGGVSDARCSRVACFRRAGRTARSTRSTSFPRLRMGDPVPDADPFRGRGVAGHTEPQFSSGLRAHERQWRDWEACARFRSRNGWTSWQGEQQRVDHRSGARVNGKAVVTSRARGRSWSRWRAAARTDTGNWHVAVPPGVLAPGRRKGRL